MTGFDPDDTPHAAYPFSALVGQEAMKRALLLNAVNPAIGGVLIRGEKGTAKSTAVRALARLLPEMDVVADCRYACSPDPADPQCADCQARVAAGENLPRARRRRRVVELPVNASEDRVVGTIDVEAAIKLGERRFDPGLLADANRNILYVDEVNLLDDHLVDVLLDAAAMGVNIVEREGISFWHPSSFVLVGTMNPEEGELRPQLLDRFGLCVDVRGLRDVHERVRVLQLAERSVAGVLAGDHAEEEARLAATVLHAGELLGLIDVEAPMRRLVSLMCIDAAVDGHRADIVMRRTATTIRALHEAEQITSGSVGELERSRPADALRVVPEDVVEAAELALAHRRRDRQDRAQSSTEGLAERAREHLEQMSSEQGEPQESGADASDGGESATGSGGEDAQGHAQQSPERTEAAEATLGTPEATFEGATFPIRRIQLPRDRRTRRTQGKRNVTRSGDRRGRYVRAVEAEKTTDLALDATIRAAAPHQPTRRREASEAGEGPATALLLERQDLRQKVRQRRTGTLIVFVVDASASMDAEQRMQATKGAVLSLLRDAYIRRDKVALVVFSGRTARVVLRPTASVDLAESRLHRLAVGGTTPLTHGLVAGLELVRVERLRDPTVYPLLVLISDGRGNISLFGEEPLVEAQRVAAQIKAEDIRALVIDSARDHTSQDVRLPRLSARSAAPLFGGYAFNACLDLAERLGGRYFGLYDLNQATILDSVQKSLQAG